ncbi:DUF6046 domain-containing protein [Flagellimonas eckloniae]|uniref:DUF6046 domain-containing protein n=1 Tax=Flagellimonas eckloniae TaxID=346185 RepID=A0A0Q1BZE2_9FLAO|nr:DUF6046 domain-containing protein [Allomuricauda eckloniae]KQC30176.1 hypothetical protein AAY42_10025 [Allomuricauda eckloniae]
MANNYNTAEIFALAFGIKNFAIYQANRELVTFDTQGNAAPTNKASYKGVNIIEDVQEASRLSYMGTPIMFPIKFRGDNYRFYDSSGDVIEFPVKDFELPAATLVNFRRAKIMATTNALANNGTVKEMYGFDDWTIDIRGLCLRDPSHPTAKTAIEQHRRLVEFENIIESIAVTGDLFLDKDIHHLVIKEVDFKQVQGKPGVIPFYLRCVSDQSIELNLGLL